MVHTNQMFLFSQRDRYGKDITFITAMLLIEKKYFFN